MKRAFDFIGAGAALLALSPALLALAILVRIRIGSPVFFRQRRPGRHGRIFTMLKFRTMTEARGADGELLPDMQRLTPLGRWLRSTSLDELPELWNVLRGDMSLVGPRPLLVHYLARYTPAEARRHEARPGLTGWAQVNGRNASTWEERLRMDVWYVDHRSFWLDLKIIGQTFGTVFGRRGVNAGEGETMAEFRRPE